MSDTETKWTSTSIATQHVLATEELLELVLLQLDIRTILTSAQRVSKTWRTLVTKSPSLQRRLFFLPDLLPPSADPPERYFNPLLESDFGPFFNEIITIVDTSHYYEVAGEIVLSGLGHRRRRPGACNKIATMLMYEDHLHNDPYRRHDASWRKMLTCQPPITRIGFLHCDWIFSSPEQPAVRQIFEICTGASLPALFDPNYGLRMGQLYDQILHRVRWGGKCGLQVIFNKNRYGCEEFTKLACSWIDWKMELIQDLYDNGAEIAVLVPKDVCGVHEEMHHLEMPFWKECTAEVAR